MASIMVDEIVLVYAGKGSSHSWVWLADLLEANGVFTVSFTDAAGFARGLEEAPSLAIVSGGDGFEIASSLSGHGFDAIRSFIDRGGRYLGICAGAYLPLPSRVEPFSELNLSTTKIRNIRDEPKAEAESSPRLAVRYGSCSVFHPIRGEVVIGDGADALIAPIYGGPVFSEPTVDRPLLRYLSFTPRTTLQVEATLAEDIMMGKPAVVSCMYGDGQLILVGPHLEHPGYREANDRFMRFAGISGQARVGTKTTQVKFGDKALDRSMTDLRVAITGMERATFIAGTKQWDGGRMLELADAIDRRRHSLHVETSQVVSALLDRSRESLLSTGPDRVCDSDSAPGLLVEAARIAVDSHFRVLRDGFILADNH
jgi:glutamine amidotransferase-like uncharacterized protein